MRALSFAAVLWGLASPAHADAVIKIATVAPDGTSWAHEARDFARDVEAQTGGSLHVKWYFGAVAGDEATMLDRIRRGQLDGAAATVMCDRVAPSFKVTHVLGLIQTRAENHLVLTRLRESIEKEMHHNGVVPLVIGGFGPTLLFSRVPINSLADLRAHRFWVWNQEPVLGRQLEQMGMHPVSMSLEDAAQAYDDGRIDGWFVIPTAALAFQWSSRAKYLLDLRAAFLDGCLVVSERSFFKLSPTEQLALRRAGDKLAHAFEAVGAKEDDALLGGLFSRQGSKRIELSGSFRAELFAEARRARDALTAQLVPEALYQSVQALLADYRADHHADAPASSEIVVQPSRR